MEKYILKKLKDGLGKKRCFEEEENQNKGVARFLELSIFVDEKRRQYKPFVTLLLEICKKNDYTITSMDFALSCVYYEN